MDTTPISFDNTYARELAGFFVACEPAQVPAPALLFFNSQLSDELALGFNGCDPEELAQVFSGNRLPEGAKPIAQAYAGHQFGQFSPQLGDGRALLIGEVIDPHGRRHDIALKGSGRTPFSRRGDGKAALGPMLREVLIGEAMHALGIPTTRALAVVGTGEQVIRDQVRPGAVLTRTAASHLRVGTFEFFAAHGTPAQVAQLSEYAIARHDPDLAGADDRHLRFLRAVAERQAALVAQWMHVGFIHGVMNTDNVSLAGETIDYGPCAFMEAYDPKAVFSSIDDFGRYAYQQQPDIARWNLARFAETLLPFIDPDPQRAIDRATEVLDDFPESYRKHWLEGARAKLGLFGEVEDGARVDRALAEEWLQLLRVSQIDFTLAWRRLADAAQGNEAPLLNLFSQASALHDWLLRWRERCAAEDALALKSAQAPAQTDQSQARAERMRRVNPWLIPRNHLVEEALEQASEFGNLNPFEEMRAALLSPYEERPEWARFAEPAPANFTRAFRTFCGT